jgi:hypothetical protein
MGEFVRPLAIGFILVFVWLVWDRHRIIEEYDKYKEDIHEQIIINVANTKNLVKRRKEYDDKKVADAIADRDNLSGILKRLRDSKDMPRGESLQLANGSTAAMPTKGDHTEAVYVGFATRAGTCEATFYEDAMTTALLYKQLRDYIMLYPELSYWKAEPSRKDALAALP